ncbi:MAG TPA: class I SAM-dependent methyltransferase [Chloroflexota bacterium]|nr:class I SAM-dependent methyltransferase [Chloroflexota bacterium]
MTDEPAPSLPPEIVAHYTAASEQQRLHGGTSRLEFTRTQIILRRILPAPPARILDVGGGPGLYAHWLTDEGYTVHLVDAVPLHVEQARAASNGYTAEVGDARNLAERDASADVVLLLGPLYHLTERADRLRALREAARIVRPAGHVAVAAICRFASLLDGLREERLDDPDFVRLIQRDLREGQHRNPDDRPGWFTSAYLHHPDELAQEVRDAGLLLDDLLAVEGPGWLLPDFDARWQDERRRQQLLDGIARIEREPSLLGASAHLLVVAHRPAG